MNLTQCAVNQSNQSGEDTRRPIAVRNIFSVRGTTIMSDGKRYVHHRVENDGEEVLKLFWVTHERWSKLPEIRNMFADWPVIDADSVWV